MWSMLPNEAMYPYTAKEARDRGELELWRANFQQGHGYRLAPGRSFAFGGTRLIQTADNVAHTLINRFAPTILFDLPLLILPQE